MTNEIRILLTEITFTDLCKMGSIRCRNSNNNTVSVTIGRADLDVIISGAILEKQIDSDIILIALQDIGIENIKEIIKRSPIYN